MGRVGRGGGRVGGVNEELIKVFVKIQKKKFFFFGGGGGGGGVGLGEGGQGGCERRIEVFVKIQKKKISFWGGGSGGGGGGGRRGRVGGVKVDVIEELKFLGKFTKKKLGGGGSVRLVGGGMHLQCLKYQKKGNNSKII